MTIRDDAKFIMDAALKAALPDSAVAKALAHKDFGRGRVVVVAVGKASWQMAKTAVELLKDRVSGGIVITKYHHAKGPLPPLEIRQSLGNVIHQHIGTRTNGLRRAVKRIRHICLAKKWQVVEGITDAA